MTVGPVLVMVVAAKTPKVVVLPGRIVGATADEVGGYRKMVSSGRTPIAEKSRTLFIFFILVDSFEY
jgi:hypothetical protein